MIALKTHPPTAKNAACGHGESWPVYKPDKSVVELAIGKRLGICRQAFNIGVARHMDVHVAVALLRKKGCL